jgi:pilus assembly protein CpaE
MTTIVLATSSAAFEQRVRRALGNTANGSLTRYQPALLAIDPAAAAKELTSANPSVIAIGPNFPTDMALEFAAVIEVEHPEVGVVIVAEPTPELWQLALRAGVKDVVAPETGDDELRVIFQRVLEVAARQRTNLAAEMGVEVPHGKVITVVAPKGGAGKTAVATNLAVALAERDQGNVALLDLDLTFGDVGQALGLHPEHTIADLATTQGGVTPTTVKVFLTRRSERTFVLCAPESPEAGEKVPEHVIERTIRLLAAEFPYVVIDTSAGLTEATLTAIEQSTDLVLLCDLSVSSLRGLRKVVDALDDLSLSQARRHFILNRADSKVDVAAEQAASLVRMPVVIEIPSTRTVPLAMNHGVPVVEEAPRSAVARAYEALADRFIDAPARSRKLLPLRRSA